MINGNEVKCFFKNGLVLKAKFIGFHEQTLVLNKDGEEVIIFSPYENLLMLKEEKNDTDSASGIKEYDLNTSFSKLKSQKDFLLEQFNNAKDLPSADPIRVEKMGELKKLLNDCDAEELRSRLSSHEIGEVKQTQYERPKFYKNSSPKQHSKNKTEKRNS